MNLASVFVKVKPLQTCILANDQQGATPVVYVVYKSFGKWFLLLTWSTNFPNNLMLLIISFIFY